MHERLSFYIHRTSPLHQANPLTKLVFVLSVILISYLSPWYWTAVALIGLDILLSFAGNIQREYLSVVRRLVLPVVGFLFVMQSLFLPEGETIIFSFWFIDVSLENVQTAFLNASRIFVMVSSFILLILTTHPSELMSDLTRRGLPGQLAYVVVSTLQILPQMQVKGSHDHRCPTLARIGHGRWFSKAGGFTVAAGGSSGVWLSGGSRRACHRH